MPQLPRFGTRSLLLAFAVAALWLSTFAGYAAAQDVRRSIMLVVFLISGFAALYSRGQQRAFWSGFFAVMLLCAGLDLQQPLHRYVPDFVWQNSIETSAQLAPPPVYVAPSSGSYVAPSAPSLPQPPDQVITPTPLPAPPTYYSPAAITPSRKWQALGETTTAIWTLALATLTAFATGYIYNQLQSNSANSR